MWLTGLSLLACIAVVAGEWLTTTSPPEAPCDICPNPATCTSKLLSCSCVPCPPCVITPEIDCESCQLQNVPTGPGDCTQCSCVPCPTPVCPDVSTCQSGETTTMRPGCACSICVCKPCDSCDIDPSTCQTGMTEEIPDPFGGCPDCQCVPCPGCTIDPATCQTGMTEEIPDPFGGCPICQCVPCPSCPIDPSTCQSGMTEDIPDPFGGCPDCQCKPCPTPCDINPRTDCESGTLIPRPVGTGCPDCMCKPCPTEIVCPKPEKCRKSKGMTEMVDPDPGCPQCVCAGCPGAVCPTSCPHGFGRVKLKNDCEKCFCKRPKGRKRFRYPYKK